MKKILITISIVLILGISFYFYIQNKVNTDKDVIPKDSIPETDTDKFVPIVPEEKDTTDTQIISDEKKDIISNNKKSMNAIFSTNKGEFTIEFFPDLAPKTVENFRKLAGEGFYNDTKFHRVIEGFMNQGGDPLSKDDAQKARWGTGGPGYQFADEITAQNKNNIGTISMANSGPNTNGSQFFINVANNNFLDTKHTVFGKVIKGMEVITAINTTAVDPSDKPLEPVVIKNITLQ